MGDNPDQVNNQTTTDKSADQPVDGNDNQATVAALRSKKRVCKSQLTKSKLLLTSLLCAGEKQEQQIRNAVDAILRHQDAAIDILNSLCDENLEFEAELDAVQDDSSISELLSRATDWLCRRQSREAISPAETVRLQPTVSSTKSRARNPTESPQQDSNGVNTDNNGANTDGNGVNTDSNGVNTDGNGESYQQSPQVSNFTQIDRDMYRQLGRVSIGKFSGNKREYAPFIDAFRECINNTSSSKAYKMLQLRQHLTGEALKSIEGFPASETGYDAALNRLEDKFGGDRRAVLIHLESIMNVKNVNFNDLKKFEEFVDNLELCILSLRESGRTEEFGPNSMFFCVARSRISSNNVAQYKRWATLERKPESVVTFHEWLSKEIKYRVESKEEVEGFSTSSSSFSSSNKADNFSHTRSRYHNDRSKTFATNARTNDNPKSCELCTHSHEPGVINCAYFRSLSVHERWSKAKEKRLCFRCLSANHRGNQCNNCQQCKFDGCTRTHHFLLHGGGSGDSDTPSLGSNHLPAVYRSSTSQPSPSAEFISSRHTHTQVRKATALVMRVVPIVIRSANRSIRCNALMDDCSTDSYINECAAAELGLRGEVSDLNVNVLGGKSSALNSTYVVAELCSLDYRTCVSFGAFTVKNVTGDLRTVDWNKQARFWPHLQGIPFPQIENTRVDVLIGLNVPGIHRAITEIAGLSSEPVARLTPLGWTCIGPVSPFRPNTNNFAHFAYFVKTESDTDTLLRNYWEIENAGVRLESQNFTKAEEEAIQSTQDTLRFDESVNRYIVGVPWKSNRHELQSNYPSALNRLYKLEHSLAKRPEVAEQYCETIRDHIRKGYVSLVDSHSEPSWYLPHFAVVRNDKSTTKVRIVMDAAAPTNNVALNDCINAGPKLQRELFDVLLRFRSKPVAIASDISEMFLRIGLRKEDHQYHRFLWRDLDNYKPVKIYEYNRLVFGNTSSPYLSQAVLREHCNRNSHVYPNGTNSVLNSMYVDDLLDSVESISEAIQLRHEVTGLLDSAGFKIRKWLSNKTEVLADIPVSDRVNRLSLDDNNLPSVKTLGVLWKAETDTFTFEITEPSDIVLTKRVVVSRTATLFDPLNLVAPFTIRAKLGIQKTWVRGLDWDDELPGDLAFNWTNWFKELSLLANVEVSRCLVNDGSRIVNKTIHVFVDASEKAFAACCYLRSEYEDGSVTSNLIVAKTRVAPLKTISIPKLELCGAILGVRLSLTVREVLNISMKLVTFWCDSQNVLYWIKGESRNYKPFVGHRVGEIHQLTEPSQWRFVPTNLNSADLATRGMTAADLAHSDAWWYGPSFLSQESSHWPKIEIPASVDTALTEVRSNVSDTFLTFPRIEDFGRLAPSRFSKWSKLLRITSWVLRFVNNSRNSNSRILSKTLSSEEIDHSRRFWYKFAQATAFSDEINAIFKGESIPKSSKLLTVHPCLDNNGVLRVDGRIGKSEHLSYDAKFPVILPGDSYVSRLIVSACHEDGNHDIGVSHTLSLLRTAFWIIRARCLVKSVKSACNECVRRRKKPAEQVMAPLPAYRLGSPLRAFARVGVDYAGPFYTKHGRGKTRFKRYLCLFTCLSSRACHLEMAWSMDTESFLCAFSRFTNRRGKPLTVLSDNGSNFISAERELSDLLRALDQTRIGTSMANNAIEWKFNPPLSPHFGGVFEAMIKSAKRAIKAITRDADVSDEELITAFTKAEGLINSRPLCYQGDDALDDPVLTPNHFIYGQVSGQLAPESVDSCRFNPRKRWRRVQELVKHFWQRWLRELLPMLNSRKKWNRTHRDFQEGDIAIVVDPQSPRGKWPLGRIIKVYEGVDNHVRVVDVKIGEKIYRRSISHLCPLDV